MKKNLSYIASLILMTGSMSVQAASILRIKCNDNDAGASIYLNDKLVGSCPQDVQAPAGAARLSVRKVEGDYERVFEQRITVVDNVPQRFIVALSEPRLTAAASMRLAVKEAATQLQAAEAGNAEAMRNLANYYATGTGVKQSSAEAAKWRVKAEQAEAQQQLKLASEGNAEAIRQLIARYETGNGIEKDLAQAQYWRGKLAEAETIAAAQAKEADKQRRIDEINWAPAFVATMEVAMSDADSDPSSAAMSVMTSLPVILVGAATDLAMTPFRYTEVEMIRREAALRPASWAKPDSMIARASRPQQASHPQVIVAAQ